MDEPGRYSDTRTNCGCLAAALFAVPLGLVALIGTIMSDCLSDRNCHSKDGLHLAIAAAVIGVLATFVGLAVNAVVRWRRARLGGDAAARAPVWAFLVLAPLGALGLWALWGVVSIFLS